MAELTAAERLTDSEYAAMAAFRHELRLFLRAIGELAEAAGLTPHQHQALLAVRGHGGGDASVGWLADQLLVQPNSASELVRRLEAMGLLHRTVRDGDRRRSHVTLTAQGHRVLERISARHRVEVARLKPMLMTLLDRL